MPRIAALFVLIVLALAGCQSAGIRAQQHAALFDQLEPAVQARLLAGEVAVGDTPEMVEIALGHPRDDQAMLTSSGRVRRTWVYTKARYVKEGSQITRIDEQRNTAQIADVYRVLNVLTCEVVFLDDRVVHVRDPRREARALAALE